MKIKLKPRKTEKLDKIPLSKAIHLIGAEYLQMGIESQPTFLFQKWKPRLSGHPTLEALHVALGRAGYAEKKRQLKEAIKNEVKAEVEKIAKKQMKVETTDKVAKLAQEVVVSRAKSHIKFVDRQLRRTQKVIAKSPVVNRLDVKDHLEVLDKQDKIARKAYGLDELNKEKDSSVVNLAVLIGFDPDKPNPIDDSNVIDADYTVDSVD